MTTDNDETLETCLPDVDIIYSQIKAIASRGELGTVVAEMVIFDDYPVTIGEKHIEITGILKWPKPITEEGYGTWRLRLVKEQ